ncbi:MAG: hypothetical protein ACKVJK_00300 [Methylophagaceae bacterium]|jgi:hypothetical protein|tara:strand:- start:1419 stop:1994 length:576 start_codon:yes stop_codon:yes gene_type:complete
MIILETPKFELVYKVYFDKDTGNILSISNVEQDIETNFIIAIQDALPYLDGTKNVTRHKVVYDIRTSSYIIVDKYKKLEIDVNDNVYKIEQQANAQVIVSFLPQTRTWKVALSDNAKQDLQTKKERINQALQFSVTQKNNPNILHEYFTTTVERLLDSPITLDSQMLFNIDKYSVYTNRKFQKYSCEVVNE